MIKTSRGLTAIALILMSSAFPSIAAPAGATKNIVLVHGAFADGSGWAAVSAILEKDGYKTFIVQPPETSLEDDVAATNRVLDSLDGPAVLVGHSYGGAIITEAGNNTHVKNLVYIAAFQPDTGESLGSLGAKMPPASKAIKQTSDGFLYLDQTLFHADFAADLPAAQADLMGKSQVFLAGKAAGTPVTSPAWKSKPSFAMVATQDRSINPELERFMYKRSKAQVVEVASSHVVYISHPKAVAALIETAAR
ncbi:alpha/beta hydrolase [Mesorhizobium sp. 113-1-2]|uniref:alpha/beta fold hydrolase n=1 Tax=Mesorhizobium sp. 113-1-2 TaxID=2744515 RepID=UPI0008198D8B|nr:hydrolase protein [Mesorhizobium loti]BCG70980.1 alpha/beta hydrolase [Mesorhizobium sp. 113-1-2]